MLPPFPNIPKAKTYGELTTPEQDITFKLVNVQAISKEEEEVLREAIAFYKEAYPYLKLINLSELSENDAAELKQFLKIVFNMEIHVQNKIRFEDVYRVSFVKEAFLEKNKIRSLQFLMHPPLAITKQGGVFGRANSSDSTLFYCAFHPGVALLETKPKIGDRIIIAHWKHDANEPFVTYPITNNKSIDNEGLVKATNAFQDRMQFNHPLFAEILDLLLEFISSEFVKDSQVVSPKKYEYLLSSFFAEKILENSFKPVPHPTEPLNHYDALIYPSIANHYETENLAIVPGSVKKLKPYMFTDCIVKEIKDSTIYDKSIPVILKVLRSSYWIEGDLIIWDDD